MATETPTVETEGTTQLQYLGIGLAALTGLIHLALGVRFLPSPLAISFVLAGLGFFGGIALFWLDYRRRLLYLVGVAFTAVQVGAYFVLNWPDVVSPLGLADKAIQVALIGVLVVLYGREN